MVMHKLDDEVKDVLRNSTLTNGRLVLPPKLERKLYIKVNLAIGILGGKWNRGAEAHLFSGKTDDQIRALWTDAIEKGAVVDKVKSFQFYETPEEVVKIMLRYADLEDRHTLLEPSAGHGAILDVIARAKRLPTTCIEMDHEKCVVLRDKGYRPNCADFLETETITRYDRIIANPPFSNKQDVTHIQQMWKKLSNGGRIVSVASSGIKGNSDAKSKQLQALIKKHGITVDLEAGAFKEMGTGVSTVIVVLTKPKDFPTLREYEEES